MQIKIESGNVILTSDSEGESNALLMYYKNFIHTAPRPVAINGKHKCTMTPAKQRQISTMWATRRAKYGPSGFKRGYGPGACGYAKKDAEGVRVYSSSVEDKQ